MGRADEGLQDEEQQVDGSVHRSAETKVEIATSYQLAASRFPQERAGNWKLETGNWKLEAGS
jgi:hypothetical protein